MVIRLENINKDFSHMIQLIDTSLIPVMELKWKVVLSDVHGTSFSIYNKLSKPFPCPTV